MVEMKYIQKNKKGFSIADITKNIIQFRQKDDPYIFEWDNKVKFKIDFHYVDNKAYWGDSKYLYNYQISKYKRKNDYNEGEKWKGGANTLKEFRGKLIIDMKKLWFKEQIKDEIKQNKLNLLDEEATTLLKKEKTKEEIDRIHDLPIKDIAKQIRKDLKERFWNKFKFSITSERNKIDVHIMEWDIEFYTKEYRKALEKEAKEQKLAKEVLDFLDKDTKGITTKKKISKWKFTLNYVKNYNSAKYIFQIKKGKKIDFYYWKNIGDIKNYFSWYNKKIDKKTEKEINKFLLKESKGITSKKTPDLIEKEINWFNVYLYYNSSRYETLRYTLMITIPIKIGWEISNRIYKGEQIIDLINYKKS